MFKPNMFLIGSLLLFSVAGAASLELGAKHVFEEEEFTVYYIANAPISQHEVDISFAGQHKTLILPTMTVGTYRGTVTFTAPSKGTYEIVSEGARAVVEVEPSLVSLKNVRLAPASISPRETAKLSYTIANEGSLKVYNVKSQIVLMPSAAFKYNGDKTELFSVFSPGERIDQVKEIVARESASGEAKLIVRVTYEFDNEEHVREEMVQLSVNSYDWMFVIAVLLIIVVAKLFFSRRQGVSE